MPETKHSDAFETLAGLCAIPTVSYQEGPVSHAIRRELQEAGIAVDADEFGNLIARLGPARGPGIAFVAHMDHPGFELFSPDRPDTKVAGANDTLPTYVRALGGVPMASLRRTTPVLVVAAGGERRPATIHPVSEEERRSLGSENARVARLEASVDIPSDAAVSLVFDLLDFELDGDVIRARALDDLAGCAAIVSALRRLSGKDLDVTVYGVFTRAEEEGLIGARAMAAGGVLPRETTIVSVEASPVIPGVAQGAGPVVRVGDRTYMFDAVAEQILIEAAKGLIEGRGEFRWQRALMSGGTCEATAFAVHGYRTTGIAFPLGNYHNATTSIPDPEGGVGAEYIAVSDYLAGIDLLEQAARMAGVSTTPVARLRSAPADAVDRLRRSAGGQAPRLLA